MFDRSTLQLLVTKLDTNAVTLKDAKAWLKSTYGLYFASRTRAQLIRECGRHLQALGRSSR